jgi:hypothetical protein
MKEETSSLILSMKKQVRIDIMGRDDGHRQERQQRFS